MSPFKAFVSTNTLVTPAAATLLSSLVSDWINKFPKIFAASDDIVISAVGVFSNTTNL